MGRSVIKGLRTFGWISVGLVLAAFSQDANAQAIKKPVTLVVPYAAGGGTDTVARLIGNQMSKTLSQPVVIENVVGAGGTTANERVARSAPDGSSVLINHVALLAAPSLFTNLRYDTQTAFEPVGLVNNAPMVLVGRKSLPGQSAKDHVSWIKAQGAKANFAHGGVGTNSQLCAVMMGNALGFKPTFVAYRGSGRYHRPACRPDRSALGPGDERPAADPERHAARHRHYVHGAAGGTEGRADDSGTGDAGHYLHHVARPLRRQGNAERRDHCAQCGAAQGRSDPDVTTKLKQLGSLPFPARDMSPEAHAQLFAADLPRVAKLVESSGTKASEAK